MYSPQNYRMAHERRKFPPKAPPLSRHGDGFPLLPAQHRNNNNSKSGPKLILKLRQCSCELSFISARGLCSWLPSKQLQCSWAVNGPNNNKGGMRGVGVNSVLHKPANLQAKQKQQLSRA